METIDSAPPSAVLSLTDATVTFFKMQNDPDMPSNVTLPGSSNLDLTLFDVTATGSVKAATPGTIALTLYGMPSTITPDTLNLLLPLASSAPEPVGGATDLAETMWMIQGKDLMIFLGSGKIQGTFKSNVANTPTAAVDLTEHPGGIVSSDPLYVFAVGATFTPDADPGDGSELCSVTMKTLTISS